MESKWQFRTSGAPGRLLVWLLVAFLAWMPLPQASYPEQFQDLLEIGAFSIFFFWLLRGQTKASFDYKRSTGQGFVLWLLTAWLFFTLFQVLPLPPEVLQMLSPNSLIVYQSNVLFDGNAWYPISLDTGGTLRSFLLYSAYAAIFFITVKLVRNERWLRIIIFTVVGMALLEAIWGLSEQMLTYPNPKRADGTFHNANHYAGFIELGLGLVIGLLIANRSRRQTTMGIDGRLLGWVDWLFSGRPLLYLICLLLVIALFQSGSRAGTFAFVTSLFLVTTVSGWRVASRKEDCKRGAILRQGSFLAILILTLSIAISLGSADRLIERIQSVVTQKDVREQYREATMAVFLNGPVVGFGAGSWPYTFEASRSPRSYEWRQWPQAHNEYLQLLSEQGVVGLLLLGSMLLVAISNILFYSMERVSRSEQGVFFGVSIGCISLLIHSWWDYQFHIPANAVYFFTCLALAISTTEDLEVTSS